MTIHATAEVVSQKQLKLSSVVVDEVFAPVAPDNIAVYAGATVNSARQVEIVTGWMFLYNGIRDRSLMDIDNLFYNQDIYTMTDIDKKGEFDRRTESILASNTDNDIMIAFGANVGPAFHGATLHLESALRQLIEETYNALLKAA